MITKNITSVIKGDRIGKDAVISTGCSATIFSKERNKILLTKRTDNDVWCLPGGRIEAGEDAKENYKARVIPRTLSRILFGEHLLQWAPSGFLPRITLMRPVISFVHCIGTNSVCKTYAI